MFQGIGGIFFFLKKDRKKEDYVEEEYEKNKLLCRFVLDGAGHKIGESIAINDDIVIIKSNSKYLGVPMKHIDEDGKTLIVKGLIDRSKAEEIGEKWRKESFYKIDDGDSEGS